MKDISLVIVKKELAMDSRDIAMLCGKLHKHVLRDIREMLLKLNEPTFGLVENYEQYYTDAHGEKRLCYLLPEMECMVLVSGYSIEIREQIIKEWLLLKKKHGAIRNKSKETRNEFTDTLKAHGYSKSHEYIQTTRQMKNILGISAKKEDMDDDELMQVMFAEYLSEKSLTIEYGYPQVNPKCLDATTGVKMLVVSKCKLA